MSEDVKSRRAALGATARQTADRSVQSQLVDVADSVGGVRLLVEAAWMAASDLSAEQCNAMQALLDVVSAQISEITETLEAVLAKDDTKREEAA